MDGPGNWSWEIRKSSRGWNDGRVADRSLNLLCLDGGGIKGLSSLYILEKILMTKDPDRPDPNPWEYFDMIGGTSTGGSVRCLLGG